AAASLEDAARLAVEAAGGLGAETDFPPELLEKALEGMAPGQKWLRGLYTGGTLCYETLLVLSRELGDIYSNIPLRSELRLEDKDKSYRHTALDLGSDEYTQGRPHPMIEPSIRAERILAEAADQELAVLLLDVVLGYGAHRQPVAAMAAQIKKARQAAAERGGKLVIAASVTGTDQDPQNRRAQVEQLEELGVYVLPSNYRAARFGAALIKQKGALSNESKDS
ncbi:MAG: FdrA family protein, partial [Firmicutes bacterium]|nr:FdrA family protein [Bacillota bacterium]